MSGLKYYFTEMVGGNSFRPYLYGSAGVLIGSETGVDIFSIEAHTESAIGVNIGVGTDIILGSLIKLHTDIGYNLFTDFETPIGNRTNYNGPEFSFGFGFMF